MPDKLKKEIMLVLTSHAVRRISERFGVQDSSQVTRILHQAMKSGLVSADGNNALVEYGCLLIVGELYDSTFVARTVLNLSRGISEGLKERLNSQRPSPWSDCLILFQEGDVQ
jgi:hypothetical protein